jgi:Zn-dependent protease with chaperone function/Zn-finger nucleic acid-binding protein
MPERPARDMYEAQAARKRTSLGLLAVLSAFYAATFSLSLLAAAFVLSLFAGNVLWTRPGRIAAIVGFGIAVALGLAWFQAREARRNGAAHILKRLGARLPDIHDRYHRRAAEVVERMRIASGLPQVATRIIPDHTINALAVVEADGAAVVGLTEGMLAEFSPDELEAVAAHEIAHIVRGDAALMTFVCAMADFFERLADRRREGDAPGDALLPLSVILVRILSRFVSREREGLADAAAVELARNPAALARALAKAHLKNTFVGDFHETYSPIFLVAPESPVGEGPRPVWLDTHPPLMDRIAVLAGMAHTPPEEIVREVLAERARTAAGRRVASAEGASFGHRPKRTGPSKEGREGRCPRCSAGLVEDEYEGVPVLACRSCGGRLIRSADVDRVLVRHEWAFDESLRKKAAEFKERYVRNPLQTMKINERTGPALHCPACGYRLVSRPYNYQYFIPVERCLDCGRIWFDTDELEILQVLVEDAIKE